MAHSTKLLVRTVRKRTSTKPITNVLGTCPVGGAGWCSFPFSPAQLQRRLQLKAEQQAGFEEKRSRRRG